MKGTGNKLRVGDTKTFILKAKALNNPLNSYEKSVYVDQYTPICITCKIHGEFWQQPKLHLKGHGCKKCGNEYRGALNSKNTKYFIDKSNSIYQNFFDYSNTIYKKSSLPVQIRCPKHGDFWQTPNNHLARHGCKICNGYEVFDSATFKQKANKIYDSKFDYSLVSYINSHAKIVIICKKHGRFYQKPNTHLNGHGCPMCKESKGERAIREFLIKKKIPFQNQYRMKTCRHKLSLPFDFAIFDKTLTLIGLIEFQGEQHFKDASFGSSKPRKDTLIEIQKRDSIKISHCTRNSIPLLIIPYWDKDKICEKVLNFMQMVVYES
jgi:hypothetical protein